MQLPLEKRPPAQFYPTIRALNSQYGTDPQITCDRVQSLLPSRWRVATFQAVHLQSKALLTFTKHFQFRGQL